MKLPISVLLNQGITAAPSMYELLDYGIGIALAVMAIFVVYRAWKNERELHDKLTTKYQDLLEKSTEARKDNAQALSKFADALHKMTDKEDKILELLKQVERQQYDEQRER